MRIKIFFLYLVFFAKVGFTQKTSIEYYNLGLLCPYDNSDSINKKAIYYFTNAIILDSNCVKCYLERANRNSDSDPENALIDYKQALRLDPNCNKCYQEIADFYRIILKDYKAARVNYYNALKTLNPISEQDFVDQFYYIQSIGLTYFSEQQNDNGRRKNNQVCIAIWDSLINLYPLTQYYEQRANLKSSHFIADYKGALQDYLIVYKRYKNKEINIFGNFTGLLWSIAECYEELGNHFESIQYYNRVIELKKLEKNNPFTEDLSKLYYCRAESKMKLFDYRGAIKDYQFAISVHSNERPMPRLLTLYNSIGRARLLLEDNQNALIDLYKGIKLSKDETITFQDGEETSDQELGESYYLIGNAKFKINNIEGACKAWSKSGELGYAEAYDAIKNNCK